MKKLFVAAVAVIAVTSMTSCKKDYECKTSDGTVISQCLDCGSALKATFETTCKASNGTVSKK